jgi:uncharacterized membrane protein (DUF485 family)
MSEPVHDVGYRDGELHRLARERASLSFRLAAIVLLFFVPLPILGGYTTVLNPVLFGGVTLAWAYAAAQFVLAIAVARHYMTKAAHLDAQVAAIGKDATS